MDTDQGPKTQVYNSGDLRHKEETHLVSHIDREIAAPNTAFYRTPN